MWAGDNLLWEIKDTDGNGTSTLPPPDSRGTVSYFQAGGIDRPLVIWKSGVGSIVTHQNWRGQFGRGTWGEGTGRVGQSSDCTGTWPQQTECVPVPWPGWNTNAWHDEAAKPQTVGTDTYWLGSLSVGMRDASNQMYMRNRYYNPGTGQFTQPDPIGLAGGLNSYGFAAGDPVSYSDPYGLCADHQFKKHGFLRGLGIGRTTCPGGLSRSQYRAVESAAGLLSAGRRENHWNAGIRSYPKVSPDGERRACWGEVAEARQNPGNRRILWKERGVQNGWGESLGAGP